MANLFLIEDDQTMRSLLKTLLEMEGHAVAVSSGDANSPTLEDFSKHNPTIVILDVHLNHGDSFDLLSKMRQISTDVKILMTSGQDVRAKCIKAGANGFLLKPYMPDELLNWIKQNLPGTTP